MAQGSSTQRVDILRINGTTADTNSGNKSAGTLRVVLATDQPNLTSALNVSPASATAPVSTMNSASANSGVNSALAAVFDDVSPTAITENSFGFLRMSANRNLYGTIRDAAGNERGANVTASNELLVSVNNASLAVTQSGTWNVGTVTTVTTVSAARVVGNGGAVLDAVNTAATAPANGILTLGIYNSTEPSPTTGQSVGIQLDSKGRQRMVLMDAAGNTRGANIDASNRLSVTVDNVSATNISTNVAQMNGVAVTMGNGVAGTGVQRVAIASDNTVLPGVGAGATGSAVPANASYGGAIAKTALPSAATDANLVGITADKFGRQVVLAGTIRDLTGTQTTTISASTSETTIVTAGGAGVFNDLVMLIISNTSASTNTRIDFRDATAGSVLFSLQSNGGQPPVGFALTIPIPQTTANNNWTAQCSASTTDIRIYAVYAKNK